MVESIAFAYLARGRLHVWEDGEDREIESTFAEQYQSRVRALSRKQAWKHEGSGAQFMRGGVPLWGDEGLESVPVSFTGVAPGPAPRTLLYSLSTGVVGGVFRHELDTGEETRLFHSADHRLEDLATCPDHPVVACTVRKRTGASVIAVMAPDGSELSEVTDGDVIDLAPRWLPLAAIDDPDRRHQLVFQSAGIGRDGAGVFVAIGPSRVLLLDAEHGELQELVASPDHDLLSPSVDEQRRLHFIRRPYRRTAELRPLAILKDALLFPFRLLAAIAAWLSFFTMRYTGKPLFTSGSARQRSADIRRMMLTGNLANAHADAERGAERQMREAIRDWELVRRGRDGSEEVLARGVHSYALGPEGSVLLSDGFSVTLLTSDGARRKLADVPGLSTLCVLR